MSKEKDMQVTATDSAGIEPEKNNKKKSQKKKEAGKKLAMELAVMAAELGSATLPAASAIALTSGATSFSLGAMAMSAALSALLKSHSALPVNKKIAPVETVSETWSDRPKANMVKWLMKRSGTSLDTVAEYLGCTVNYLNNKLTRDSFSFEDLILVAYACGYTFTLVNNEKADETDSFRVDLFQHFAISEPKVLERINRMEEEKIKAAREEYEQKKAELERMKAEYGFED